MNSVLNPESVDHARQSKQSNRFILFGFILFLCGLIVGLLVPNMANTRMALASHLKGIMNGLFLVVLGLVWNRLVLSQVLLKTTLALALYGTFANLAAIGIILPTPAMAVVFGLLVFLHNSLQFVWYLHGSKRRNIGSTGVP